MPVKPLGERLWLKPTEIPVYTTPTGTCFHQLYCQWVMPRRANATTLNAVIEEYAPCPHCSSDALYLYWDDLVQKAPPKPVVYETASVTGLPHDVQITVPDTHFEVIEELACMLVPIMEDDEIDREEVLRMHRWLASNMHRLIGCSLTRYFYETWREALEDGTISRVELDLIKLACRILLNAAARIITVRANA